MRRTLLLALVVSTCSCAGTDDGSAKAEQAFVNGTETDAFPAVGRIWFGSDATGWSTCTATLIRPQVVLTAAHCVTGRDDAALKARFNGKRYDADTWVWSGYYESGASLDRSLDWAIAHLTEPVTDVEWMRMTGDVPPPATWFTGVGFGQEAAQGTSGTKRSVAAWVTREHPNYVAAKARASSYAGAGTATACFGDSGSPAIDSEGRVFGVLSKVPRDCQQDGAFSYTRVSVEWGPMHEQISAWGQ